MNTESSPNRRFGGLNISRGQVQLRFSLIRQWNVGFDEELAAGESSALAQAGLGPLGPGDVDTNPASRRLPWQTRKNRFASAAGKHSQSGLDPAYQFRRAVFGLPPVSGAVN